MTVLFTDLIDCRQFSVISFICVEHQTVDRWTCFDVRDVTVSPMLSTLGLGICVEFSSCSALHWNAGFELLQIDRLREKIEDTLNIQSERGEGLGTCSIERGGLDKMQSGYDSKVRYAILVSCASQPCRNRHGPKENKAMMNLQPFHRPRVVSGKRKQPEAECTILPSYHKPS